MNKPLIALLTVAAALCADWSSAQELTLGSNAPKLEVKEFVRGEAVKGFEKGKTYVVEFWATWCGPCRTSIPHLTKLQKQYKELTIIGVAILEQDQSKVAEFVEEMGDKMDYRVAIDKVPEGKEGEEGAMVKNWMEPAEQAGIPFAVVINGEGKVAWIGHPGQMDEPLEKIMAGKWDIAAEALKLKEIIAQRKKLEATFKKLQSLFGKFENDGDAMTELLKELDVAAQEIPDRASQFSLIKLQVLSSPKGNVDQALALGTKLLESELGENPEGLNNIAWMLVTPDREKKADAKLLKFALKAALKADNLSKREDPSIADTLAKAYFDNGQLEKAVETQERVVELAVGTELENDPAVKKRLRQYKRALEASKKEETPQSETPKKK